MVKALGCFLDEYPTAGESTVTAYRDHDCEMGVTGRLGAGAVRYISVVYGRILPLILRFSEMQA